MQDPHTNSRHGHIRVCRARACAGCTAKKEQIPKENASKWRGIIHVHHVYHDLAPQNTRSAHQLSSRAHHGAQSTRVRTVVQIRKKNGRGCNGCATYQRRPSCAQRSSCLRLQTGIRQRRVSCEVKAAQAAAARFFLTAKNHGPLPARPSRSPRAAATVAMNRWETRWVDTKVLAVRSSCDAGGALFTAVSSRGCTLWCCSAASTTTACVETLNCLVVVRALVVTFLSVSAPLCGYFRVYTSCPTSASACFEFVPLLDRATSPAPFLVFYLFFVFYFILFILCLRACWLFYFIIIFYFLFGLAYFPFLFWF